MADKRLTTKYAAVILCLIALLAYFMYKLLPLPEQGLFDLSAYLRGGRAILAGADPYEPGFPMFGYAPAVALAFAPIAALDFAVANQLWFWFSFILIFACTAGIVYLTDGVHTPHFVLKWLVLLCIAFAIYPVYSNAWFGQINAVLFGFYVASLVMLKKGYARVGGVALGIAASVKFVPLVFIAHAFWKRSFGYAISGLVTFIVVQLVPALIVPEVFEGFWITKVPSMIGLEDAYNGSLANLTSVWTGGNSPATWIAQLIALGALGLPFLLFVRQRGISLIEVALLIAATALFGPVVLNHHLTWMLLPLWIAVRLVVDRKSILGIGAMLLATLLYSQPFRLTRIIEGLTTIKFPPDPLQGGTVLALGSLIIYMTLLILALTQQARDKRSPLEMMIKAPLVYEAPVLQAPMHGSAVVTESLTGTAK